VRALVAAFVLAALPFGAHAEWIFDAEPALSYASNLSNAQHTTDAHGDEALRLDLSGGQFVALSGADTLTATIEFETEQYRRYQPLSHVDAGGAVAYRHKFGLGYAAPWVSLSASAARQFYRDSIRDGDRIQLQISGGRRISERLDASAGWVHDRRDAHGGAPEVPGISGQVFDLNGNSVFVRLGYAACDRLSLSVRVDARRGDIESTAEPGYAIYSVSSAIAEDPTFGADAYAYRLRGTTYAGRLGASWALGAHSSINLDGNIQRTLAANSIDYHGNGATLSYIYRY
jgi:hypothetical protein